MITLAYSVNTPNVNKYSEAVATFMMKLEEKACAQAGLEYKGIFKKISETGESRKLCKPSDVFSTPSGEEINFEREVFFISTKELGNQDVKNPLDLFNFLTRCYIAGFTVLKTFIGVLVYNKTSYASYNEKPIVESYIKAKLNIEPEQVTSQFRQKDHTKASSLNLAALDSSITPNPGAKEEAVNLLRALEATL